MYCPKCQTQIDDNLNFCSNCGANLKAENTEVTQFQSTNPSPNQTYQQPPMGNPYNQQQPAGFQNYQQPPPNNPYYQQPPVGNQVYQQNLPPNAYYRQPQGNYQQFPNYGSQVNRPTGIALIAIYEILFGVLIALIGLGLFSLGSNSTVQLNDALGGTNYAGLFYILGIIFILWGILGILGGIFFMQWKESGYVLSLIFLISSGVLFIALYFIPTIAMIVALVYLFSNQNFKNTFNYMKYTRR